MSEQQFTAVVPSALPAGNSVNLTPTHTVRGKAGAFHNEKDNTHHIFPLDWKNVLARPVVPVGKFGRKVPVTNRVIVGSMDAYVPLRIQGPEMLAKWGVSKGEEGENKGKSIQLELTPSDKDQPEQVWNTWKMFNNFKDFDDWFLKTGKEKRNEWWPPATKEDEYDDKEVGRAVQRLCVPKISSKDTTKSFPPAISVKVETERKDPTENTKFFKLKDPNKKGKERFAPENIEPAEWTDINSNARIVPLFELNHLWLGPLQNRKVSASWKAVEVVIVTGGKKKDDGQCHAQEDDTPMFTPAPVADATKKRKQEEEEAPAKAKKAKS